MAGTENQDNAGGISIHAVDVSRGVPAGGLAIRLRLLAPDAGVIAQGECAANGHFEHTVAKGTGVRRGLYEVEFEVGAFFRQAGVAIPDQPFLDIAVFRFGIDAVEQHFHLPFKFTPWGFSLFRGGA